MAASFPSQESNSEQQATHVVERAARAAIEMLECVSRVVSPTGSPLQVRLGMHVGPVTAGVLGKDRLQYDVWGDTVNVASRMESAGEPGRIHVSEAFASALDPGFRRGDESGVSHPGESRDPDTANVPDSLTPDSLTLQERGVVSIKGKGPMTTYWLEGKG
jgi:class 3 adenylate cyclase